MDTSYIVSNYSNASHSENSNTNESIASSIQLHCRQRLNTTAAHVNTRVQPLLAMTRIVTATIHIESFTFYI